MFPSVFWTDPWPRRAASYAQSRRPFSPPVHAADESVRPELARRAGPRTIKVMDDSVWEAEVGGPPPTATVSPERAPERRALPDEDEAAPGAPNDSVAAKSEQERWRQARSELEAAKQRVERDAERAKQAAQSELVAKVFPALDSLDRCIASSSEYNGMLEGVRLVRSQLAQVLSDFGVERIDSVGRPFDPQQHEAVDVVAVDSPSDHNRVTEDWEAGYRYAGRVLRPSKVRVGKLR